ncbi:MAG: mechanosensitive ion channel domain-containing protein [Pyrinomonadaceae bacterium]
MLRRESFSRNRRAALISRAFVAAWLLLAAFVAGVAAQNSNTPANASANAPAATPSPTPVPLAAVIAESEPALASVGEIDSFIQGRAIPVEVIEGIPATRTKINVLRESTNATLADTPTLEEINAAEREWKTIFDRLSASVSLVKADAVEIEKRIEELSSLSALWKASASALRTQPGQSVGLVPDEVLRRIESVLASIGEAERRAVSKRTEFLTAESRLSELQAEAEAMLSSLRQQRGLQLVNIFSRSDRPLWAADPAELRPEFVAGAASRTFTVQWNDLSDYAGRHPGRFVFHGVLLLALIAGLLWARRKIVPLVEEEPKLRRPAAFFELPVASALIVSALFSLLIYPQPPGLLRTLIAAAAIIPGFLVVRRIIESPWQYLLYGLLGLFVLDRAREVLLDAGLAYRVIFSLEMLAAGLLLIWFYRSKKVAANVEASAFSAFERIRRFLPVGAGIFLVACIASILGFVTVAYLVGSGLLRTAYLAIFLYTAVQILASGVAFLLRARPFSGSRAVRNNRSLIVQKVRRILAWTAGIIWLLGILNNFAVRDSVFSAVADLLGYRFSIGEIAFSIGDILLFAAMVWAAFLISRFVRFILEEDVYPRLGLGDGASFAISSVFHYLLLILAFFIAISAVGFELSRFAIVAGAIGVGLGFGLQNIINNFVSGLILLFEQPVKVGDTVQIGEHMGSLKSIGLRASVVRKVDGSDVIVPNSQFISEEVINWTMLDERRRIDIPVGVKYGSNSGEVQTLLLDVARRYDQILTDPAPAALFTGMGESSIDFELRVWTVDTDGWVALRSELVADVYNSLNEAGIGIPFPTRDIYLRTGGGDVE